MDLVASNLLLILCFAVGTGLMIVEAFLPGFGIAGVSGLILEIAGIILAYRRFGTVPALIALAAVLLVVGLVVFFSYRSAMNGRISKSPLVLKDTEVPVAAAESPWLPFMPTHSRSPKVPRSESASLNGFQEMPLSASFTAPG